MADQLDLFIRAIAHPTAWLTLLNGLDDIFIDVNYYVRGLFRSARRDITTEDLKKGEEKRIAILLPAWRESKVIRRMLEHNLQVIDYGNYEIFVGTYKNDPDTQQEVDAVASRHPNVHKIVVPHDGPTNKADCLNWVFQGLRLAEERSGRRADVLVTHDAEDLIHPLELRLFNHLVPEHDFVQTPVFPLELPAHQLVGGTYLDEFAEHHLKDMLVREAIGGLVPSAGVGSGFARDAFEEIALANSQLAFNTGSLTEDYEIGLKFRLSGKKVYFACRAIKRIKKYTKGNKTYTEEIPEYIATREYFPSTFSAAVRQRSRWITGITLQAWEQTGWRGPAAVRYCLYRDRKALVTNYVSILGYVVFFYSLLRILGATVGGYGWTFDRIFPPGSVLWWLVMGNTVVLSWRAVMKFVTVDRVYGPKQALLSIPRFFVANLINFAATTRALGQWTRHKMTGAALGWQHTEHEFPTPEALHIYRRKLGELLVEKAGLREADLHAALGLQRQTGAKLGAILRASGVLSIAEIARAMGEQFELQVVEPDPFAVPLALLARLPEDEAARADVMPLSFEGPDVVALAIATPPSSEVRARLEEVLRARVAFRFASEETIRKARRRAYRRLVSEREAVDGPRERLGDRLVRAGLLSQVDLDAALVEQRETGERLGEILVHRGLVRPEEIGHALQARTAAPYRPYQSVGSSDANPEAVARLGYGFCALHQLLPLRRAGSSDGAAPPVVAAAAALHPDVVARAALALGAVPEIVLAPSLDLRLALAVASRRAFPGGIRGGAAGVDGAELAAIEDAGLSLASDLLASARRAGRSPVDHLLAEGHVDEDLAARLRAGALGVEFASEPEPGSAPIPPLLAPDIGAPPADVFILSHDDGRLVVGTVRPTPALAREVTSLFPDAAVTWRVLARARAAAPSSSRGSQHA